MGPPDTTLEKLVTPQNPVLPGNQPEAVPVMVVVALATEIAVGEEKASRGERGELAEARNRPTDNDH